MSQILKGFKNCDFGTGPDLVTWKAAHYFKSFILEYLQKYRKK